MKNLVKNRSKRQKIDQKVRKSVENKRKLALEY